MPNISNPVRSGVSRLGSRARGSATAYSARDRKRAFKSELAAWMAKHPKASPDELWSQSEALAIKWGLAE